MCEEEASVVEMRTVEKAASGLSGPVGGSMSCVLSLDAVVLGDDGASYCVVGRRVAVGDVAVSYGGDMELSGIDTVVSDAVSGGLCDLERVSGGDVVVHVGEVSWQEVVTQWCLVLTSLCVVTAR